MKNITVQINSLTNAKHEIGYAIKIANLFNFKVKVLFTLEMQNFAHGAPYTLGNEATLVQENINQELTDIEKALDKTIEELKDELAEDVTIIRNVTSGFAVSHIDGITRDDNTAWVMTFAREDNDKWTVGDNAFEIIENSKKPVWVIPIDKPFKPIQRIVYATDYHKEDIDALKKVARIAGDFDAEIIALHVTNNDDYFEDRIKNIGFAEMIKREVGYAKITLSILKDEHHTLGEAVNDFAKVNSADLIVALKEDEKFMKRLFSKSHTHQLLKKSDTPLLVYHE